MARTIKVHEHTEKRSQILDAAQQIIYTKGYAQLTIQDLLDTLQISKGAFYHYFDSKQALLEALVERLGDEAMPIFAAILSEQDLSPLVRLQRFFDTAGRWKVAQKDYLLLLLQTWYADDNVLVRLHSQTMIWQRTMPLLSELISDGVRQGILSNPFPEQAAVIVQALLTSMSDAFAKLLLADQPQFDAHARAERLMEAYNDALERVLGAPAGSLHLIDAPTLHAWFAESSVEPLEVLP